MDLVSLIVQLISGAAGGNVAAGFLKPLSLGLAGNTLAGAVGGALGGQILGPAVTNAIAAGVLALDPLSIIAQMISGGAGGSVVMILVGLLKNMAAK